MAADQRRQAGAGSGAATPYNKPNLSSKGSLKVLDDNHLLFADIASPNTTRNLRHNPAIEINIVDPLIRRGFCFKGVTLIRLSPMILDPAAAVESNVFVAEHGKPWRAPTSCLSGLDTQPYILCLLSQRHQQESMALADTASFVRVCREITQSRVNGILLKKLPFFI
jgi:hypothetical protein